MSDFLQRLQQRKRVHWALAYIAAASALIQVLDVLAQRFGWPDSLERVLMLALLLAIDGGLLWRMAQGVREPVATATPRRTWCSSLRIFSRASRR